VIHRYEEIVDSHLPTAWYKLYLNYLSAYIQSEQFDKAEIYVHKVDSVSGGTVALYEERAFILAWRKQYDQALEMINKAVETAQPVGKPQAMGAKMMILLEKGDVAASKQMFRDIVAVKDSVFNDKMNAQLDEIRTQYEVDKITAEKERNRNYFILALGGCVFLSLALGIWIFYSRAIIRKNRGLYLQIKEQDRLRHNVETLRARSVQTWHAASLQYDNENSNTQQRELISRLHNYLLHDKNFTKPDIDRDDVVSELITNKTYLFESVKTVTGKTLLEYINSLRLEEAKRLLESEHNLPTQTIADECGFHSRSTFYRLFDDQYHISPKEYRKMAKG
jgi:AraC-like DNA-binding protein